MILIGVAVSALLNAVITTIISLGSQDTVALFYSYLVGTLQDRTWQQVLLVLPWLPAAAIGYALTRRLNILQLGDTVATGLGVRAGRLRIGILLLAIAAMTAAAPDETPSNSGPASAFRMPSCISSPARASRAPARAPSTNRGSRDCQTST